MHAQEQASGLQTHEQQQEQPPSLQHLPPPRRPHLCPVSPILCISVSPTGIITATAAVVAHHAFTAYFIMYYDGVC